MHMFVYPRPSLNRLANSEPKSFKKIASTIFMYYISVPPSCSKELNGDTDVSSTTSPFQSHKKPVSMRSKGSTERVADPR